MAFYVIKDRYGRPGKGKGKGNDKGKVEGLVGFARRNFMVPMPRFDSLEVFNEYLEVRCRRRQDDVLRGHTLSIRTRLEADFEVMAALPDAPFEACDQQSGGVTSTSLVRYKGNDYSVPVRYGHRDIWIKGFVDTVVIGHKTDVITTHKRSYKADVEIVIERGINSGELREGPATKLPLILIAPGLMAAIWQMTFAPIKK